MASPRIAIPAKHLFNGFQRSHQHVRPCTVTRGMATEAPLPSSTLSAAYTDAHLTSAPTEAVLQEGVSMPPLIPSPQLSKSPQNPFITTTACTLYDFPSFEPKTFAYYPSTHLLLPLRKDILHRAVIFEGDATRLGTANTKHRSEVHGSNRKIRPQKGTGMARLGDKKSPMLRGGGVAFGPKPRDFATGLQKKVYDLAWRTALSYRYRRGELIVLHEQANIGPVSKASRARYLKELLRENGLGHPNGRSLFITMEERKSLFDTLQEERLGREAEAKDLEDVDVKDLLELGKLVIEKEALDRMLREHQSDLVLSQRLNAWRGERLLRRKSAERFVL